MSASAPSLARARGELKRVGCSRASGNALAAMYADLCADRLRGAKPEPFFRHFLPLADRDMPAEFRRLCDDVWAYTAVLLNG